MAEQPATNKVSVGGDQWDYVAASASAQIIRYGGTGGYLSHVVIVPETTSPGAVSIVDGSGATVIFTGGASSVSTLQPFVVPIGAYAAGVWKLTTGSNVHCIVVGRFG